MLDREAFNVVVGMAANAPAGIFMLKFCANNYDSDGSSIRSGHGFWHGIDAHFLFFVRWKKALDI